MVRWRLLPRGASGSGQAERLSRRRVTLADVAKKADVHVPEITHEHGFTPSRLGRMLYAWRINGRIMDSHSREVGDEILTGHLQQNKFRLPGVPTTTFVEGNWFDGATCPVRVPAQV